MQLPVVQLYVIIKIDIGCVSLYWFIIVLYCIEGVVIAAQCTATFQIYCAPPHLGITRT